MFNWLKKRRRNSNSNSEDFLEVYRRIDRKLDKTLRAVNRVPRKSARKTTSLLLEKQIALQKEIDKLKELRNESRELKKVTRTDKTKELLGKAFVEQTKSKLTDISAEVAQGLIFRYLQKLLSERDRILVSDFKQIITEREKICSRASFFRHLKTLEKSGYILRERRGRSAYILLPAQECELSKRNTVQE